MRRLTLLLLLTLSGAASAALPRVSLQAPLMPVAGPTAVILPNAASASPLSTLPLPSAPLAFTASALPSAAPAPTPVAAPQARAAAPRVAEALRENAGLGADLAKGSLEDSARALGENFMASAAMDSGVSEGSPVSPAAYESFSHHDLELRLLQRLRLEDSGDPARSAALKRAVRSVLETPTGRGMAEQFIAEGVLGTVRFETFEGSRLYDANGRRIFYAPRAFTDWKNDHVEVRMNLDYLGTDAQFQEQDLPPTLAHELFGHGLWYWRAAAENALQAFHHHELNETNARLVGWLVDFEMDRAFEESGAWGYLQDPAQFLRNLKLRLPYYALTFSNEELARPLEALESRLVAARAKRDRLDAELANHRSWNSVIDHFVGKHGIDERRFAQLRRTMADTDQNYRDEIATMDAIISDVDGTIGRMKAEPDRQSERYLQWAAAHPLFARLEAAARENARRLAEMVAKASSASALAPQPVAAPKSDQLTFDDLMRLYREDRERHPGHWNG
ncbi:MAG: hypothetical protein A2506_13200 [Elusimicrobia bacterium RIFOXYD12_FULL_66_9]|nr:MAG: hypothetical protein A2506_13200 [Elusimicrobia bacterium RIFOXYD12_FULL_66_9]